MLCPDAEANYLLAQFEMLPTAIELAERLLGPGSVRPIDGLRTPATLAKVGGVWRIYVRPGQPPRVLAWAIRHEVGELCLKRARYCEPDAEDLANQIAAALSAPRRGYGRACAELGPDFAALADDFGLTQTSAALRYGEVTGTPVAVLTPRSVRVRDAGDWRWPSVQQIRRGLPGMARVELTDAPQRVALVA